MAAPAPVISPLTLIARARDDLIRAENEVNKAEQQLAEAIAVAKRERYTWRDIASIFDVSHQAIYQRFARTVDEILNPASKT